MRTIKDMGERTSFPKTNDVSKIHALSASSSRCPKQTNGGTPDNGLDSADRNKELKLYMVRHQDGSADIFQAAGYEEAVEAAGVYDFSAMNNKPWKFAIRELRQFHVTVELLDDGDFTVMPTFEALDEFLIDYPLMKDLAESREHLQRMGHTEPSQEIVRSTVCKELRRAIA